MALQLTGAATPSHPDGGTFDTDSLSYTNPLSGDIGYQCYYWMPPQTNTISGRIIRRDTGDLVVGAQLLTSDSETYTTDSNGVYTIPVPYEWTGSVVPSDALGGIFSPSVKQYADVLVPIAGQNYLWTPPLPTITGVFLR